VYPEWQATEKHCQDMKLAAVREGSIRASRWYMRGGEFPTVGHASPMCHAALIEKDGHIKANRGENHATKGAFFCWDMYWYIRHTLNAHWDEICAEDQAEDTRFRLSIFLISKGSPVMHAATENGLCAYGKYVHYSKENVQITDGLETGTVRRFDIDLKELGQHGDLFEASYFFTPKEVASKRDEVAKQALKAWQDSNEWKVFSKGGTPLEQLLGENAAIMQASVSTAGYLAADPVDVAGLDPVPGVELDVVCRGSMADLKSLINSRVKPLPPHIKSKQEHVVLLMSLLTEKPSVPDQAAYTQLNLSQLRLEASMWTRFRQGSPLAISKYGHSSAKATFHLAFAAFSSPDTASHGDETGRHEAHVYSNPLSQACVYFMRVWFPRWLQEMGNVHADMMKETRFYLFFERHVLLPAWRTWSADYTLARVSARRDEFVSIELNKWLTQNTGVEPEQNGLVNLEKMTIAMRDKSQNLADGELDNGEWLCRSNLESFMEITLSTTHVPNSSRIQDLREQITRAFNTLMGDLEHGGLIMQMPVYSGPGVRGSRAVRTVLGKRMRHDDELPPTIQKSSTLGMEPPNGTDLGLLWMMNKIAMPHQDLQPPYRPIPPIALRGNKDLLTQWLVGSPHCMRKGLDRKKLEVMSLKELLKLAAKEEKNDGDSAAFGWKNLNMNAQMIRNALTTAGVVGIMGTGTATKLMMENEAEPGSYVEWQPSEQGDLNTCRCCHATIGEDDASWKCWLFALDLRSGANNKHLLRWITTAESLKLIQPRVLAPATKAPTAFCLPCIVALHRIQYNETTEMERIHYDHFESGADKLNALGVYEHMKQGCDTDELERLVGLANLSAYEYVAQLYNESPDERYFIALDDTPDLCRHLLHQFNQSGYTRAEEGNGGTSPQKKPRENVNNALPPSSAAGVSSDGWYRT